MIEVEDPVTRRVIEALLKVHKTLGPGFLEAIYRRSLVIELAKAGLPVVTEKEVVIYYEAEPVGRHRLDLVVGEHVILELKTVEELSRAHYAQVRSYLKATGMPVGLLVNFATERVDFRRIERV
jgi:GxxExxY protein